MQPHPVHRLQAQQRRRRAGLLIPSSLGYDKNQKLEPVPRNFDRRQRLYNTVNNDVRRRQESEALGADLAGVVLLDVQVINVRPPIGSDIDSQAPSLPSRAGAPSMRLSAGGAHAADDHLTAAVLPRAPACIHRLLIR